MASIKSVLIPLILLQLLTACVGHQQTYEEGIVHCEESRQRNIESSGMPFISTSCIHGSSLPYFERRTIDGKSIDPSYFHDKVTVINFWFEGCPPCIAEIPYLNQIVDEFGTDDYNYLAICRDEEVSAREFLRNTDWKFDHIGGAKALIQDTFKFTWGYPTTFIVDRHGIIVESINGIREAEELAALLRRY